MSDDPGAASDPAAARRLSSPTASRGSGIRTFPPGRARRGCVQHVGGARSNPAPPQASCACRHRTTGRSRLRHGVGSRWRLVPELPGVGTSSSPEEIADYLDLFRQDGALNWYRASRGNRRASMTPELRVRPRRHAHRPAVGTGRPLCPAIERCVGGRSHDGRVPRREVAAGHWLIQNCPEAVRNEISAHLASHPIDAARRMRHQCRRFEHS